MKILSGIFPTLGFTTWNAGLINRSQVPRLPALKLEPRPCTSERDRENGTGSMNLANLSKVGSKQEQSLGIKIPSAFIKHDWLENCLSMEVCHGGKSPLSVVPFHCHLWLLARMSKWVLQDAVGCDVTQDAQPLGFPNPSFLLSNGQMERRENTLYNWPIHNSWQKHEKTISIYFGTKSWLCSTWRYFGSLAQ